MSGAKHRAAVAVAEIGLELLKGEIRERLEELREEPLGHLLAAGYERIKSIRAAGGRVEDQDVAEFIEEVPAIVRFCQEQQARSEERKRRG